MSTLLIIAIAMLVGLLSTRLMKLLHLPNVTGYLIVGLLIGPVLNLITGGKFTIVDEKFLKDSSIITDVALGFIAFSIGGEFKLKHIKQLGGKIVTITMFQALSATLLVDIALWFIAPHEIAIVLGAIATATAPAATLMVVRQYKAKGPVVSALLPVVAFDDAVGLMVFSVSIAIAGVMIKGESLTFMSAFLMPMWEITQALCIGFVLGLLLAVSCKFFRSRANRLGLMICAVLFGAGLAILLNLSSLLICMMIGAVFCNMRTSDAEVILEGSDRWTPPLFMLFFVLSGANLNLSVIPAIGIVGVVYIIARSLGKYFGSFIGCKITRADKNVTKYLGLALLPQAGVAIGMAQIAVAQLPTEEGQIINTVVLCATLVYELVGPVITKIALERAGEIEVTPKRKKVKATATVVADADNRNIVTDSGEVIDLTGSETLNNNIEDNNQNDNTDGSKK